MGARYAMAANAALPGKLRLAPRRVLITMALHTYDRTNKGRERGIYVLGYECILGDMCIMPTKTTLRQLKRDIADLINLGLLEQVRAPMPGQRAAWRLLLPVDKYPLTGALDPPDTP